MSFVPRPASDLDLIWPEALDHFSASGAKMAVRCPEQWRQRYVLGIKQVPALAALAGRADHGAIEKSMAQKIDSYVDLPVGEVRDAYVEILEREVEQAGGISEIETKAETKSAAIDEYDEIRRHGQDVVAAYQQIASPLLQPIAVEKPIEIVVPDLPVKVVGYIDLIAADSSFDPDEVPLNTRLIDRKRRTRSTTKIEPEWTIQAEIYQLAEPLPHEWQISVTTKEPRILLDDALTVQPRKREYSEKLLQGIVASIGFYYAKYGPDEPWPATGRLHSWACSYCAYKPDCWGWK